MGESSLATIVLESQDPPLVTLEVQTETADIDNPDLRGEPAHENETVNADEPVAMESV